eukprot:jgi/Psemu1/320475/estExt_fgenesh1_pm.C_5850002
MSGVGKGVIAAGIARVLSRSGTRCAPFRAQSRDTGTDAGTVRTSPALLPDRSRRKSLYESLDAALSSSSPSSSLSAAPTDDQGWGTIGIAQSLQAEACKIVPRVEMNPLVVRSGRRRNGPNHQYDTTQKNKTDNTNDETETETETAPCVVVHCLGKQVTFRDDEAQPKMHTTHGSKSKSRQQQLVRALQRIVLESHRSLQAATGAEAIVVQGAGSCSELHLMDGDGDGDVNMNNLPLVRCLQCPWLLVASDEHGGVYAQVVGTKMCLSKRDWELCVGVIVNKVRGNAERFASGLGLKKLEQMTGGKPLFAVPFLEYWDAAGQRGVGIDVEKRLAWERKGWDSPYRKRERDRDREQKGSKSSSRTKPKPVVVVIAYPHSVVTNDLDPLEHDGRFCLEWRRKQLPRPYPSTTAVILPDSRLALVDLKWLHDSGWADFVREHVAAGGTVLGLCRGYQMLGWNLKGETIGTKKGIGLLPISSAVKPAECKIGNRRVGQLYPSGVRIEGYEINCGFSEVILSKRKKVVEMYQGIAPLLAYDNGKPEGMLLGRVKGTYIHGMLRSAKARLELLVPKEDRKRYRSLRSDSSSDSYTNVNVNVAAVEDPLEALANHLQSCGLDHNRLRSMIFTKDTPQ